MRLNREGVDVTVVIRNKVASFFRRPRPVTREEAARIADWVNEGGAVYPAGPPPVIDDQDLTKRQSSPRLRP